MNLHWRSSLALRLDMHGSSPGMPIGVHVDGSLPAPALMPALPLPAAGVAAPVPAELIALMPPAAIAFEPAVTAAVVAPPAACAVVVLELAPLVPACAADVPAVAVDPDVPVVAELPAPLGGVVPEPVIVPVCPEPEFPPPQAAMASASAYPRTA
jgi:hypothetical protein